MRRAPRRCWHWPTSTAALPAARRDGVPAVRKEGPPARPSRCLASPVAGASAGLRETPHRPAAQAHFRPAPVLEFGSRDQRAPTALTSRTDAGRRLTESLSQTAAG